MRAIHMRAPLAAVTIVAASVASAQGFSGQGSSGEAALRETHSAQRLIEIKDIEAAARFKGAPAVSRDGKWVAYTVCDPARVAVIQDQKAEGARIAATPGATQFSQGCDVQVMSLANGAIHNPTEGAGNNWGPVWAPDTQRLLFYSDRDGAPRLWLWARGETKPRRLLEQQTRTLWDHELPAWTPDGQHVVAQLATSDAAVQASGPAPAAAMSAVPPDVQKSARPQMVNFFNGARFMAGQVERAPEVTVNLFRTMPAAQRADEGAAAATTGTVDILPMPPGVQFGGRSLAVINVATGQVRTLTSQIQPLRWRLSADGRRVAAFEVLGMRAKDYAVVADLVMYELGTGERRVLATRVAQGNPFDFAWSPDGRWIAYIDCNAGLPDIKCHGDAWVVATDDAGKPRRLSGAPADAFNHRDSQPRWTSSSTSLYLTSPGQLWRADPESGILTSVARGTDLVFHGVVSQGDERSLGSPDNGRTAYVITEELETRRYGIAAIDLARGTMTRLRQEQAVFSAGVAVLGGKDVLVMRSSAHQRRDLWTIGRKARQLTRLAPHLEQLRLGHSRMISFKGRDGTPLRAALLLPADYQPGRRYPLMVSVYASVNQSEYINDFGIGGGANFNYQMLAARGWAVLKPDMPVHVGTPMKDVADTVLPAVDAVIALGIADPERLAVNGQSNGGFSTLALITQANRFKAAIAESLYADTASLYLAAGGKQFVLMPTGGGMGVRLWEDPQRYIENSPLYKLDRVTTPLMLYAGTEDRLHVAQTDEVYSAMADLGKDVTYLRYEGETHAIITVANKIDNWNRVWEFLTRHVPAGALQ